MCEHVGVIADMTTDLEKPLMLPLSNGTLKYCVDYLKVEYVRSRSLCQMCGNETVTSKGCATSFVREILVTFRTSRRNNFKGFEMKVVCFNAREQNLPGCIQTLPAEKEKSMTTQEDSHFYYSAVRNCSNIANTFNDITICAFRLRSSYLQMPRHCWWTFTQTKLTLPSPSQVRNGWKCMHALAQMDVIFLNVSCSQKWLRHVGTSSAERKQLQRCSSCNWQRSFTVVSCRPCYASKK